MTPDEYRVSKVTGEVLHRTIGPKQIEYVPGPEGAGAALDVAGRAAEAACLDDAALAALRRARRGGSSATSAATRTSSGRSTRDGELFVLQSRPVTVRAAAKPAAPQSAMDRS